MIIKLVIYNLLGPVAQWIEPKPSKLATQVRFLSGSYLGDNIKNNIDSIRKFIIIFLFGITLLTIFCVSLISCKPVEKFQDDSLLGYLMETPNLDHYTLQYDTYKGYPSLSPGYRLTIYFKILDKDLDFTIKGKNIQEVIDNLKSIGKELKNISF